MALAEMIIVNELPFKFTLNLHRVKDLEGLFMFVDLDLKSHLDEL